MARPHTDGSGALMERLASIDDVEELARARNLVNTEGQLPATFVVVCDDEFAECSDAQGKSFNFVLPLLLQY